MSAAKNLPKGEGAGRSGSASRYCVTRRTKGARRPESRVLVTCTDTDARFPAFQQHTSWFLPHNYYQETALIFIFILFFFCILFILVFFFFLSRNSFHFYQLQTQTEMPDYRSFCNIFPGFCLINITRKQLIFSLVFFFILFIFILFIYLVKTQLSFLLVTPTNRDVRLQFFKHHIHLFLPHSHCQEASLISHIKVNCIPSQFMG